MKVQIPHDQAERDKKQVAQHEAGHILIAIHFGLPCWGYLVRAGEATVEDRAYIGRTHILQTTDFRSAVIAFGGPIVDYLYCLEEEGDDWHDPTLLDGFADQFYWDENAASLSDRAMVERTRFKYRAMKTAWRIVTKNREKLEGIAKSIEMDVRPALEP
jgi:hypothetical protein